MRYFFDFELTKFKDLSEKQAFLSIFEDLTYENYEENLGKGDDAGNYAYTLQMVNPEIQTYYNKGMEFFGMNNFRNIPLPYSGPGKTFGDLIDQFFTECENKNQENNKGSSIKSDAKKKEIVEVNNKNDGYYEEGNERERKDQKSFELEVFWNRNKLQAWV